MKYYEITGLNPELPGAKRVTITAYSKDWGIPLFDIPFYRYSKNRWIGGVPESEVSAIEFKMAMSTGSHSVDSREINLGLWEYLFLIRRALDRSTRVADLIFLFIEPNNTLARMLGRRPFAYKHFYNDLQTRFLATTKRSTDSFERFRLAERICYFSHFDPNGEVQDYCKAYLSHLRECGFEILLSTTCQLTPGAQAWLADAKIGWISRANFGRDFGSWLFGLKVHWPSTINKWVLLANDSVFGPIFDLRPSFARAESMGMPVVGATDSYELCHHLQSYFLYMRGELFAQKWMQRFWDQVPFSVDKWALITDGELGFSRAVQISTIPIVALWPYGNLNCLGKTLNGTHYFWRELIESHQFPFIKRELLAKNPSKIKDVSDWTAVIGREQKTVVRADQIEKALT